jgi:crotonobetainyl-CoA:carnitine CoA-transferase CaiB-like acyl-CoA transferase
LRERGVFASVEQPGHGTVLHPVSPYRFSTLAPVAPGPAPRLGEHNAEVGAST